MSRRGSCWCYTKSADGEKDVAFTLIDGVFTTYDFPGAKNTYFYAPGNDGRAAGHYEDSNGLFHGVILQNDELRQYDFPGAVQTEIHGISDATGALTGNFTSDRRCLSCGEAKTAGACSVERVCVCEW